jgi:hypothetical protein
MEITAAQVKDLREKTGAGMMECKSALGEAGGNTEEAIKILRKKGLAAAAKKAGRIAARRRGVVHPRRRAHRRPRRGELRDGLRRAHARLPGAREGHRDAHRGVEPRSSFRARK